MKTMQKPKKLKTVVAVLSAIFAVVLTVALVITFWPENPEDPNANMQVPTVSVETPYCALQYPEQWKDKMTVKESASDTVVSETFYAVIGEKEYALYTVHFGASSAGDLFGFIKHGEKSVPVYIECHPLTNIDTVPDNELALLYSMMEGVNQVAQSVAAADGYSKQ